MARAVLSDCQRSGAKVHRNREGCVRSNLTHDVCSLSQQTLDLETGHTAAGTLCASRSICAASETRQDGVGGRMNRGVELLNLYPRFYSLGVGLRVPAISFPGSNPACSPQSRTGGEGVAFWE